MLQFEVFGLLKIEIMIQSGLIHVYNCTISKFIGLGLIDIGFIDLKIFKA